MEGRKGLAEGAGNHSIPVSELYGRPSNMVAKWIIHDFGFLACFEDLEDCFQTPHFLGMTQILSISKMIVFS